LHRSPSSAAAGSPAYGLTKFNVLNFGITHSVSSPLATYRLRASKPCRSAAPHRRIACICRCDRYVCGGFCGALFLAGLPLINYLPRFCLSGLLVFGAAGFIAEHSRAERSRA
jgi:hypothetical protein